MGRIKKLINEIYLMDIESLRNLAIVSKGLQDGGLTVPGNIKIQGNLEVEGESNLKKQTTINELYGGQAGANGWRDIKINGENIRFVVNDKKYGFHNDDNGLYYFKNDTVEKLPINNGAAIKGELNASGITVDQGIKINGYLDVAGNLKVSENIDVSGNLEVHGDIRELVLGNPFFNNVRKWDDIGWDDNNKDLTDGKQRKMSGPNWEDHVNEVKHKDYSYN